MEDQKLSTERLVQEALALLNEEGIAGLSMRKLAARVGIRAPTLYWYVPDKASLLTMIMETLFNRCLDAVERSDTWQEWMRGFGRAIWRVQDDVPYAALLITSTDLEEAFFARIVERMNAALGPFDIPGHDLMRLQSAVQALMTGWSTFAHANYARHIDRLFEVEEAAFRSLDALIDGWEIHKAR